MKVLVINSGSSSVKYKLFESHKVVVSGHIDGIGLDRCLHIVNDKKTKEKIKDHHHAIQSCLAIIIEYCDLLDIDVVGHRVVHGGEFYKKAVLIDQKVIDNIKKLADLAPLHNPPNLEGILACKKLMANTKQVAVFDTAFHSTIPKKAFLYAIPYEYYEKYKIRKYGFHGTSHKYIASKAKEILGKNCNLITCHLGNGASITAIRKGESIDTSMGFTPLQGLIMGTRSGDVDPGVVSFLVKKTGEDVNKILWELNHESGLKGICKMSDVRSIYKKSKRGKKAQLALDMFCYRIVEYIGAYAAVLGKVDAIVFTAGIGENAHYVRSKVCDYLSDLGVVVDNKKNKKNELIISAEDSKVEVLVIPTNEELQIAKEAIELVG
ncbi:MAG: Acetate kinase [Candidatus Woesearchaeota archaeon]|nr:Acetate kinase [Candidatus Woesearchaeota archaeon]